jgi:hypothetical protein
VSEDFVTEVKRKIESRGHWRVQLRPTTFNPSRIAKLGELAAAAEECQVELTGWPYPYIPDEGPARLEDHVEASVSFAHYHELWRLYQSGLFVHLFAMPEDWYADSDIALQLRRIKPGSILDLQRTLYTLTEFFTFAARLTERLSLGPEVWVEYRLFGTERRQLQTLDPQRVPLGPGRKASDRLAEFGQELTLPADELIARANAVAVDQAMIVFERFNWEPARENVVEDQRRFLERRF